MHVTHCIGLPHYTSLIFVFYKHYIISKHYIIFNNFPAIYLFISRNDDPDRAGPHHHLHPGHAGARTGSRMVAAGPAGGSPRGGGRRAGAGKSAGPLRTQEGAALGAGPSSTSLAFAHCLADFLSATRPPPWANTTNLVSPIYIPFPLPSSSSSASSHSPSLSTISCYFCLFFLYITF